MHFSCESKCVFAAQPRTERARAFNLGGDPKGKTFLYTNDNNVYIRDIENPAICDIYCDHGNATSVAKYSPSGYYIASGDVTGKLRIWDTTQKEHILKYEYRPLSYKINDIAWGPESKRIAVCGEGRDLLAAVILWDTGTTTGTLNGNNKSCNAIDFKPTRPFRIVTASEDYLVGYYEGPPFKKTKLINNHRAFVNTTRFSPDGKFFVSGGSDRKVFLFTGKDGDLVAEFTDGKTAHEGGIYSSYFSPDSTRLVTASGDKTVKLWDVETQQVVTTFCLGKEIEDQQLSVLWQGDYILSCSLSGNINYLDKNNPGTPLRIVKGHNKNISKITLSTDAKTIYSAGLDNKVRFWDIETGECDVTAGTSHASMVTAMSTNGNTIASVGMDDKIRFIDAEKKAFTDDVITLDKQPQCVTTHDDLMAVGTVEDICLFKNNVKLCSEPIKYTAKAADLSPTGSFLAVGGSDKKVHIFDVSEGQLKEINQLTAGHPVTALEFSRDGTFLACAATKNILVWKVADFEPCKHLWPCHTACITCLTWSPNSKRIATGGMDSNIGVWDVDNWKEGNFILGAHPKSVIITIAWRDDATIVSGAHDKCIKQWKV